MAGAVHKASWSSCGARFVWQAQYTEPPGRAAARVGAAGPRLPFVWQAPLGRGCLSCGRRSTQSLLVELRRAWALLGRGCLSCGRRSTQSLLVELRRVWAPLGRGCLLCGRRSTQSLLVELRRAWAPLGRGCHTPSFTHSFVTHHLSHTIFHTHHLSHATLSHTIFPPPPPLSFLPSPSPLHHFWLIHLISHTLTHHSSTSHTSLITSHLTPHLSHHNSSQLHFSHLTSHTLTHHSSTSHTSLLTSQPITAPLLTPSFTHPL